MSDSLGAMELAFERRGAGEPLILIPRHRPSLAESGWPVLDRLAAGA